MNKKKKPITPFEVIEILRKANDSIFDARWAILGIDFKDKLLNSEYQDIIRKVKEISSQIKELEHNLK